MKVPCAKNYPKLRGIYVVYELIPELFESTVIPEIRLVIYMACELPMEIA